MRAHSSFVTALLVSALFGVACSDDSAGASSTSTGGASPSFGGAVSVLGGAVSSGGAVNGFGGQSEQAGAPNTGSGGAPNVDARGGSSAISGGAGGESTVGAAGAASEAGAANAPFECHGSGAHFATGVVAYEFGGGQNFGQDKFPASVLGAPRGGGCCGGSLDVTSLGDGGSLVLEFENNVIVDGEGVDLLVFENAFVPSGASPESVFAELGEVSVSQDGETWFTFPCSATSYPYGECAGWHPVFANVDTNSIDATDASVAGGDGFDLGELGLGWARYVRIADRPELAGGSGTFDLDAVAIVHSGCP